MSLPTPHGHSAGDAIRTGWEVTWADIDWLRSITRLPIILKGILHPGDAVAALDHGVDGVIVSNHGGRNLDTSLATIDALGPVADAVQGRMVVMMDGGVRRGTDVLKALALGAKAVLIGRPYVYGLFLNGHAGVSRVIEILNRELVMAMLLAGETSANTVGRDIVRPLPPPPARAHT
jgi:4-hydroxymandelate oxidase